MRCCGRLTSGRSVQISATRCCQRCSSHGPGQHRSAPGRRRGSSCPSHTAAGTACSARQRHRCGGSPSRCAPRRKTCTAPAPARQQAPSATIVPWRSHAHTSPQPHARASLFIATRQYTVVTHTPWRRSSPARLPSAMRLGGCETKRTRRRAAARPHKRAAPSRVTATRAAQNCAQGRPACSSLGCGWGAGTAAHLLLVLLLILHVRAHVRILGGRALQWVRPPALHQQRLRAARRTAHRRALQDVESHAKGGALISCARRTACGRAKGCRRRRVCRLFTCASSGAKPTRAARARTATARAGAARLTHSILERRVARPPPVTLPPQRDMGNAAGSRGRGCALPRCRPCAGAARGHRCSSPGQRRAACRASSESEAGLHRAGRSRGSRAGARRPALLPCAGQASGARTRSSSSCSRSGSTSPAQQKSRRPSCAPRPLRSARSTARARARMEQPPCQRSEGQGTAAAPATERARQADPQR